MTLHAAATEGDKTKIVCPGCDEGRGCSHCGYRGWVWHYLTECPICHSAVSVVNGEAELCECQKQGDVEREEGVPEHLAALRRDLDHSGLAATLPDDIIVAVLAYHAAHKANEDAHAAYVVAAKNFAEGQDGVLGSLGEACDTAFDVRQAAQITLVLAVERMGVAK